MKFEITVCKKDQRTDDVTAKIIGHSITSVYSSGHFLRDKINVRAGKDFNSIDPGDSLSLFVDKGLVGSGFAGIVSNIGGRVPGVIDLGPETEGNSYAQYRALGRLVSSRPDMVGAQLNQEVVVNFSAQSSDISFEVGVDGQVAIKGKGFRGSFENHWGLGTYTDELYRLAEEGFVKIEVDTQEPDRRIGETRKQARERLGFTEIAYEEKYGLLAKEREEYGLTSGEVLALQALSYFNICSLKSYCENYSGKGRHVYEGEFAEENKAIDDQKVAVIKAQVADMMDRAPKMGVDFGTYVIGNVDTKNISDAVSRGGLVYVLKYAESFDDPDLLAHYDRTKEECQDLLEKERPEIDTDRFDTLRSKFAFLIAKERGAPLSEVSETDIQACVVASTRNRAAELESIVNTLKENGVESPGVGSAMLELAQSLGVDIQDVTLDNFDELARGSDRPEYFQGRLSEEQAIQESRAEVNSR